MAHSSSAIHQSKNGLKHRADIDGLRAIAVLAVIAFHIHFKGTPGGFVGVDVFFVISGYLITAIILRDLDLSRFSVAAFYERRVRRIMPALVAVLVVSCALAYAYLLPSDLEDFGRSLVATALSASNFYFFTQAGYFASSGPLLHTWSLAVEEQFYIAFPLFLALCHRYRKGWLRSGVFAVAFLSLAISAFSEFRHPVANFFMPYTRAWELLVGSLLTLGRLPRPDRRIVREICAATGALLVLAAVFLYSEATPFPGLSAIPPCLGAALIIYAGEGGTSLIGVGLSLRPLTFLGAISYSLYLWHWPFLIFGESGFLHFNGVSHRVNVAIYLFACIAVASLSWKFIEEPFRGRRLTLPRNRIFQIAISSLLVFVAAGLLVVAKQGFSFRYPPAALRIAAEANKAAERDQAFRTGQCFLLPEEPFSDLSQVDCLRQDAGRRNYLLLGDSHAAALWKALAKQLRDTNVMQVTSSNCKPFPGQGTRSLCGQLMSFVYGQYLPSHKIEALVINARWKERDLADIAALARWCESRSIRLIVIGPSEEYDAKLPILLAYSIRNNDPGLAYKHRLTDIEQLDRTMQAEAEEKWNVRYLSLIQNICDPHSCQDYADAAHTVPMLFDHDHYTLDGAEVVVGRLLQKGAFDAPETRGQVDRSIRK